MTTFCQDLNEFVRIFFRFSMKMHCLIHNTPSNFCNKWS